MKELGKARVLSRTEESDLLIEALTPVEGGGDFRAIAFKASRIDCVFAIEDKISAILLDNGVTIPVALPFADLKRRIYRNDFSEGDSIDLTLVSGKAVGAVQELRLAKKFNPAAAEAPTTDTVLKVTMFAHAKATDREFRRITVSEKQIDFYEPSAQRKDTDTFISLKKGVTIDGWTDFFVAMPLTNFTYYLNQAKLAGREALDISEATRPRDTKALKMD
jgi:hypothetical protein